MDFRRPLPALPGLDVPPPPLEDHGGAVPGVENLDRPSPGERQMDRLPEVPGGHALGPQASGEVWVPTKPAPQ